MATERKIIRAKVGLLELASAAEIEDAIVALAVEQPAFGQAIAAGDAPATRLLTAAPARGAARMRA